MIIGSIPIALGIVLRLIGVEARPTTTSANWVTGVGFIITIVAVLSGFLRARHPVKGPQKGLRREEAFAATLTLSFYVLGLMIFLP
jgi:cytochrome b561